VKRFSLALVWLAALPACSTSVGNDGRALGSCPPSPATTGLFDNAICVCHEFRTSGRLYTHAPAGGRASVAANGWSAAAEGSVVEGSWVAGDRFSVSGNVTIRDDLRAARDLDGAGVLSVGHDLDVGGNLSMTGSLSVGGTLAVAGNQSGGANAQVGAHGAYQPLTSPPCNCDPATLVDVAAKVAEAQVHNDNAKASVSAGLFSSGAATVQLHSGSYYFDHVTTLSATKLVIDGVVAMYLDGQLDLIGDDQITLLPGATLDLYVSGIVGQSGRVDLGGNPPSAFRLYVGGNSAILEASGDQRWSGLIYAPNARVAISGRTTVSGAIFAGQLDYSGELDLYYSSPAPQPAQCPPANPTAPDGGTPPPPGNGGGTIG
jgi:hypothetical protein